MLGLHGIWGTGTEHFAQQPAVVTQAPGHGSLSQNMPTQPAPPTTQSGSGFGVTWGPIGKPDPTPETPPNVKFLTEEEWKTQFGGWWSQPTQAYPTQPVMAPIFKAVGNAAASAAGSIYEAVRLRIPMKWRKAYQRHMKAARGVGWWIDRSLPDIALDYYLKGWGVPSTIRYLARTGRWSKRQVTSWFARKYGWKRAIKLGAFWRKKKTRRGRRTGTWKRRGPYRKGRGFWGRA